MLWQPRSIRQLVLLGFVLVALPLGLAVGLTVQHLDRQAREQAELTRQTITLTRATQQLQADLLDLERRAHQYATLRDRQLLQLVLGSFDNLKANLDRLFELLEGEAQTPAMLLRGLLGRLQQALVEPELPLPQLAAVLARFDEISRQMQALKQRSRAQVDTHQAQQRAQVEVRSRQLLWLALALGAVTLLVALLFSHWISRPVQQVERVIRQLGGARSQGEIRIDGPRELQLLGRQLAWLRDHLVELDAQKLQFLRHISHELKTPLASLREGADLLAEGVLGPPLNTAQGEVVGIMQQNSHELQRLIENLLDYNQLLERQAIEPIPCALPALVDEILTDHRLSIQRQALRVEVSLAVEHWVLDRSKTRAALDNLISNAISYAEPGSAVAVRAESPKGGLVLEVANSGQPIEEDEAERIFEPFFQGRARRQGPIKGSGIGLSVARECVQAQGGSLHLAPCKGYDVCFRVILPPMEASG